MKKINTVKKNDDFSVIIKKGIYYKTPYFNVYEYQNSLNKYRFGISVGKKSGNAVIRNKIKRQLRNIIDKYKNYYSNTLDYIIIVKKDYDVNFFNKSETYFKEAITKLNEKRKKQ